ncbi:hypothetical protein [Entomospira culicis]|uniref:LPS export ABC transporter periplasmic protein LptC n=1 Tax=Entomospira culicis TaxID=2719989 RepID=A0A968GFQ4_9SPIO|nr:hypothetical protein [Entomospira culicis]NIZ19396.1 hypothetical protein [Entomospira culicis]NIZ69699.1 hypothetical protein [Entomospira culicis]WDI36809.1 hypothetical protein PVA46_05645 [Entomospira culicis]WDI38438.1 hypothetical protein PVA47_05655 [Entomospira culicis]
MKKIFWMASLSLLACVKPTPTEPPIEASDFQLVSYYQNSISRTWQAQHVSLLKDTMTLTKTTMKEAERTIVAQELSVPLHRGTWLGKKIEVEQKDLTLTGNIFSYHEPSGIMTLEEEVYIRQPRTLIYAQKLLYDSRTHVMDIDDVAGTLS